MSCSKNCHQDPTLMLSIFFTFLSFALLTISYSKIFIECPLSKLTRLVAQHTDQIDTIVQTTQSNSKALADHSSRLALHDKQLDAMLEGTFSPDFAKQVRKYFP